MKEDHYWEGHYAQQQNTSETKIARTGQGRKQVQDRSQYQDSWTGEDRNRTGRTRQEPGPRQDRARNRTTSLAPALLETRSRDRKERGA